MSTFTDQLAEYVPGQLEKLTLPGAALALIEDGEPSSYHCFGYADKEQSRPLAQDTIFQVASVSKAVSAWGVMKLVEAGRLDLDAPVESYLSRWKLPASEFDSSAVTARLLLMHFAGTSLAGCGGTPYEDSWYSVDDVLYGRTPGLEERHLAYAKKWGLDPAQYGEPVHLLAAPGERFEYSGGGFTVLELLIEEISGQSFTDFMAEQVLQPLGMASSTFEISADAMPRVAQPYDDEGERMPLWRTNGKAAGGMYASIEDLARFAAGELAGAGGASPGRGVLSPESVAEMHRPARFAEEQMDREFWTGLGHYVVDVHGIRTVHHTGGNPGWRSVYAVIPERRLGFACLINSAGGNALWMDLIERWSADVLG